MKPTPSFIPQNQCNMSLHSGASLSGLALLVFELCSLNMHGDILELDTKSHVGMS